jgi:hypothetical protein
MLLKVTKPTVVFHREYRFPIGWKHSEGPGIRFEGLGINLGSACLHNFTAIAGTSYYICDLLPLLRVALLDARQGEQLTLSPRSDPR